MFLGFSNELTSHNHSRPPRTTYDPQLSQDSRNIPFRFLLWSSLKSLRHLGAHGTNNLCCFSFCLSVSLQRCVCYYARHPSGTENIFNHSLSLILTEKLMKYNWQRIASNFKECLVEHEVNWPIKAHPQVMWSSMYKRFCTIDSKVAIGMNEVNFSSFSFPRL